MYHLNVTQPAHQITTDFIVVGAGVAGLRAAIELAQAGRVLILAKDSLIESSSEYAQGGIAVALSDDDELELHERDTIAAGDGLCNVEAVRTLVEEGPAAIEQLIEWGTAFDRSGTDLLFAREGAHSRNRVMHAHGDSTGREIVRSLRQHAGELPNLTLRSFSAVTDLVTGDGRIAGISALDANTGSTMQVLARATLLATGGLGRVFENTTNPDVATGDGVACAYRAGAEISDIEFVQFHPTALYMPGAPRFLLSEALRGEGAYLLNSSGERFMARYHPMAELAPRDVVSRSIVTEMRVTGDDCVFLDLTHLPKTFVRDRFPRVYQTCLRHGVDLEVQPAPVRPAAHYAMGGVRTDLYGRTSLNSLFAAGETACTGVHGANRLASNSLLEAVVFGARVGKAMKDSAFIAASGVVLPAHPLFPKLCERELRTLTWNACGILRTGLELQAAYTKLQAQPVGALTAPSRLDSERRNMWEVARLIAQAALAREESRGGHYRLDFPTKSSSFEKHSIQKKQASDTDAHLAFE